MDTYETVMKIRFKLITALHSNNTYILREAPRFSGKLSMIFIKYLYLLFKSINSFLKCFVYVKNIFLLSK